MGLTTGLVALALWGAEPAPAADPKGMISCELQVLTVEGLGWRDDAYAQMKPAARQGSATVWTADREVKAKLERAGLAGRAVKAPKVTSSPDAVATIRSDKAQEYISHMERFADGPINAGTAVAYRPEVGTMREGFEAAFAGRRLDQGVLAKVKLAEAHVAALHTIQLHEQVKPAPVPPPAAATAAEVGRALVQAALAPKAASLAHTVQIPEVYLSQVEGEWLVPSDGILLISLGVNTVADAQGKAVVHERLAIFDFARPADAANVVAAFQAERAKDSAVAPAAYTALAMPAVPDRSIPEAVDADGKVYELPPLPEAYASADINTIAPGTPAASPQTIGAVARASSPEGPDALPEAVASADLNRIAPGSPEARPHASIAAVAGRMVVDPQLARTSLEAVPDREVAEEAAMLASYQAQVKDMLEADAEAVRCNATACPAEPAAPAGLASVVESFLRKGMGNAAAATEPFPNRVFADIVTSLDEACPAAGCPFAAEACDEAKPASARAANVEMGITVKDGQGACVSNVEADLAAALKTPGKPEVKYVPLGGNLSLEIQARVVPRPDAPAKR